MQVVLGYWNVRGMAQSIRLLLEYTGTDYTEKRYDISHTKANIGKAEWLGEKYKLGLPFPNLPYLIDGPNKLTHSNAIMRHIARKYNLCGTTGEEMAKVDMMEYQVMDLRKAWSDVVFNFENMKVDKDAYFNKTVPVKLNQFSKFIHENQWCCGDKITYADFLLYELLDVHKILIPSCLDAFMNLQNFTSRFESLEQIKKYMNSPKFISNVEPL